MRSSERQSFHRLDVDVAIVRHAVLKLAGAEGGAQVADGVLDRALWPIAQPFCDLPRADVIGAVVVGLGGLDADGRLLRVFLLDNRFRHLRQLADHVVLITGVERTTWSASWRR